MSVTAAPGWLRKNAAFADVVRAVPFHDECILIAPWFHFREADMGDSISLLLMALLSLQVAPANAADDGARAAKSAATRCAVVASATETADADPACRKTASQRARAIRVTIPPPAKTEADVKPITVSAAAH